MGQSEIGIVSFADQYSVENKRYRMASAQVRSNIACAAASFRGMSLPDASIHEDAFISMVSFLLPTAPTATVPS